MFNTIKTKIANMGRTIGRLVTITLLSMSLVSPVLAENSNPAGQWQSVGGEARYQITLCGDGTQLCAKLTWLRSDARTTENLAYLNRYIIQRADSTGNNKWAGTVVYEGKNIKGSVTLIGANTLKVNGCRLVLCQSLKFVRM